MPSPRISTAMSSSSTSPSSRVSTANTSALPTPLSSPDHRASAKHAQHPYRARSSGVHTINADRIRHNSSASEHRTASTSTQPLAAQMSSASSRRFQNATVDGLDSFGSTMQRARRSPTSSLRSRHEMETLPQEQQQWWENVLPPGQLAERLRRAQRGPTPDTRVPTSRLSPRLAASPPLLEDAEDGPRATRASILRSSVGSTARAMASEASDSVKPDSSSSRSPKRRATTIQGCLAPPPLTSSTAHKEQHSISSRSASTRSSFSMGELTSATSSGNEDSPTGGHSPELATDQWAMRHWPHGNNSSSAQSASGRSTPTGSLISRSKSNRRSRVLSDNNLGLGLSLSRENQMHSCASIDEHFRQWHESLPFEAQSNGKPMTASLSSSSSASSSSSHMPRFGLRPFPRTSSSNSERGATRVYSEEPEASSEEESSLHERLLHNASDAHGHAASRGSDMRSHRSQRTSSLYTNGTARPNSVIGSTERDSSLTDEYIGISPSSSRRGSLKLSNSGSGGGAISLRHVSFSQDIDVKQGSHTQKAQSVGRVHGRAVASSLSQNQEAPHRRGSLKINAAASTHQPSRLPSSMLFPSSQHADPEVRLHAHSHVRGKRMPSHSAPTSPRMAFQPVQGDGQKGPSRPRPSSAMMGASSRKSDDESDPTVSSTSASAVQTTSEDQRTSSSAELALLSSLGVAQAQFASARSLASALTRQLSAPLRPMLHLTLFFSISSMAFVALTGFLLAGYLFTIWDDINNHGRNIHHNVNSARKGIHGKVTWTRRMLGMPIQEDKASSTQTTASATENAASSAKAGNSSVPKTAQNTSGASAAAFAKGASMTVWRYTFGLPVALAQSVTPSAVVDAFVDREGNNRGSGAAPARNGTKGRKRTASSSPSSRDNCKAKPEPSSPHQMPPRPPLSSLLPSIAFTVVIALGAGLASFFASRAAGAAAGPTGSSSASGAPQSSSSAAASPRSESSPPLHHRHDAAHLASPYLPGAAAAARPTSIHTSNGLGSGTGAARSARQSHRRAKSSGNAFAAAAATGNSRAGTYMHAGSRVVSTTDSAHVRRGHPLK